MKKRFEAVFISDLHLHPDNSAILARFENFVTWAALNTEAVYILGDFFHAWPGDDGLTDWSCAIAKRLRWLREQEVKLYFMHGNRDFLLGETFAKSAGLTLLAEPSVIRLDNQQILLTHGDRYCIHDKSHQRFRKLTRNRWFSHLFLRLPLYLRLKLVAKVRQQSQMNRSKTQEQMDVVVEPMIAHMQKNQVSFLIHGHTHKPGLSIHCYNKKKYSQYVLSDWDDSPQVLCYYAPKGLEFSHIESLEG